MSSYPPRPPSTSVPIPNRTLPAVWICAGGRFENFNYSAYISYGYRVGSENHNQHWGNLHRTDWEYEKLLSVIVMRNPIDRFLAGGKCDNFERNKNWTAQTWWDYANADCADNFALKVLSPTGDCCNGSDTSVDILDGAKDLLRRFTFVLDQDCLDESMTALGRMLNLTVDVTGNPKKRVHPPARERIANDTLYAYLQQRFHRDIELYEWSKTVSIVDCLDI